MALAASPLPCSEVAGVVQRQSCAAWTSPRAGLSWVRKVALRATSLLVLGPTDVSRRRIRQRRDARATSDTARGSGKRMVQLRRSNGSSRASSVWKVDIALMGLWRGVRSRVGFERNTFLCACFAASRGQPPPKCWSNLTVR